MYEPNETAAMAADFRAGRTLRCPRCGGRVYGEVSHVMGRTLPDLVLSCTGPGCGEEGMHRDYQ